MSSNNGNGRLTTITQETNITPTPPKTSNPAASSFEHPLMLKQSSGWSRGILWTLMFVSIAAVAWASVSKIEQAVPAQGKLEPQDNVNEVQIPIEGVVKTIHVKDGHRVKAGDLLVSLDPTVSQAQENSFQKVRTVLEQENQFYQAQLSGKEDTSPTVSIPAQFVSLTRSRAVLLAENRLFQAQLDDNAGEMSLSAEQRQRVKSELEELTSRVTSAQLEIDQLQKQYSQADIKLKSNQEKLKVNEQILTDISELALEGGISRIQYLNQQQEVESIRAEIAQLQEEKIRLQAAIAQAQAKVQNTKDIDRRDLTARIGNNSQRIAEIDSQLSKAIVDNKKRIAELDSQLSQTNQALKYSVVRSLLMV